MKLLVTGGAGYLGSELCRQAVALGHEVLATRFRSPPPYGQPLLLDVRDAEAVDRALMRHGPDGVVHTAYVQAGPALEETVVRGSHAVAAAAQRAGSRLVHLSTDLVFDGEQGAPYSEASEPRPVGDYGAAKLEAERLVAQAHPQALIVRTSLLYGKPGPQEALALRDGVELYTDEMRCPTRVDELAAALLELVDTDLSGLAPRRGPGRDLPATSSVACCARRPALTRTAFAALRALAPGGPGTSRLTPRRPPGCSGRASAE